MTRALLIASLLCLGCMGKIVGPPAPGQPVAPAPDAPVPPPVPNLPPPPACHDVPTGHTWIGLDGQPLGADRADVDVGADSARIDTYLLFGRHVESHIGIVVNDLLTPDVAATFGGIGPYGAMPSEWYLEPEAGPMVLYTNFRIAFQACYRLLKAPPYWVKNPAELTQPPTVAGATDRCKGWMEKMWAAEPTDDQLQACVELLTQGVASESDPVKQWSYGCAAVFTSAQEMAR